MWHLGNALGGTSTPTLLSKVKAPFPFSSFISVVAHRRHKLLTCVSLPLCSCTNWTETQREKSFWMISSASCKKEVRSSVCVCVRVCMRVRVRLSSLTMQSLLIFHWHGRGLFSCLMIALWWCSPLLVVPRLTRMYSCLGMDWLTFCLLTRPPVRARTLTHTRA